MTNKEIVQKNIELTFDFIRQIIDNPQLAEQLPDKCEIDFIEKDYSTLNENELSRKKLIKVNHIFELVNTGKS
jgi:hypothetical protein